LRIGLAGALQITLLIQLRRFAQTLLHLLPSGQPPVVTENSIRVENAEVPSIHEILLLTTMRSLFVAFLSLFASSFLTRAALQAEILAFCHQLTVLQKNAPPRLRFQRSDRLLWGFALAMVARLEPESIHRSPRYSDRLAP